MRTFRLETVTARIYQVPISTFLRGKSDPDSVDPAKENFKKVVEWKEAVNNFEPFQWRYQQLTIKDPLPTGGYCMEVEGAGSVISRKFFTVTSVGVVVKRSENSVFAYVTGLIDNEPLKGASVVVFENLPETRNRSVYYKTPQRIEELPVKIMASGKTGNDGVYQKNMKSGHYLAVLAISSDGSYAICNTGSPARFQREKDKYMIYTDRPVYRSGDTVHYKIIGKERKQRFTPHANQKLYCKVLNSDSGKTVSEGWVKLDEWGTAHGNVLIEESSGLGTCMVRAGPSMNDLYASGIFYVEQYRKPEYTVELTPSRDYYINGDELEFRVEGKYFFGAPVKGGLVQYRFYERKLQDSDTNYWWEEGGSGGGSYNRLRLDGAKYLDSNGIVSLKLQAGNYPYDREITLEATVIDESNVSITSRKTVRVGRGEFYIKINPEQNFFSSSEKKKVNIRTLKHSGEPVSANVKIELFRYIWKPYQRVYVHEKRPRFSKRVTTDSKGTGSLELPAKFADFGEYDIVATGFDRRDNRITASRIVWVYNPSGAGAVASRFRNLELSVNKSS